MIYEDLSGWDKLDMDNKGFIIQQQCHTTSSHLLPYTQLQGEVGKCAANVEWEQLFLILFVESCVSTRNPCGTGEPLPLQ